MTILNKIRISAAVAAVILAVGWVLLTKEEVKQDTTVISKEYKEIVWMPERKQWLQTHSDPNETENKSISQIEKIDAVRIATEKEKRSDEDFSERQPVKTQKFHIIDYSDTLSSISEKYYGTSRDWRKIFEANRKVIDDPDVLPVGEKILIPE